VKYVVVNVLLTKFRSRFNNILGFIGNLIAKTGVEPIYLTFSSLVFALIGLTILVIYRSINLYILFIILSSLMDSLDGYVARLMNKVSARGAFLDSTIDRVTDAVFIYSLTYIGFNHVEVLFLLVVSYLISYIRARSESLGLSIEGVGLIERSERVIFILAIFITRLINELISRVLFYILLILSILTLLHRFTYVYVKLDRPPHRDDSSS